METQTRSDRALQPGTATRRTVLGLALGGLAVLAGLETMDAKPKRRLKGTAKKGGKRKPSATAKKHGAQQPKFKIRTRTFSNGTPISISAGVGDVANPYPSEIKVTGFKQGKVLDVNVTLKSYSHTYPDDVDVLLESPNFRRAVIMSDVGSSDDVSNLTIKLDDQAAAALPASSQLGGGTFRPTNDGLGDAFPAPAAPSNNVALSTFKNINPNGLWKLYVVDDAGVDGGSIAGGWSLQLKVRTKV
jgi:hypothetical protein